MNQTGPAFTSPWLMMTENSTLHDRINYSGHYTVLTGCLIIICALLGVIGNGVIAVVVITKRLLLQTITHMFVLNLAVSHLLLCSICSPFEASSFILKGHWLGGTISCKIIPSLQIVFTSANMLTLSAISIDRYYSVVYPLEKKLSAFKAKLMIFWVWVHSIIISLPLFFTHDVQYSNGKQFCLEQWQNITQAQVYFIAHFLLTILGPVLVTCCAYIFVWRAFRLSQRRINVMNTLKRPRTAPFMPYASKTEVRLLKMLFIMIFCYLIFWAPFVVYRFQYFFGDRKAISVYFAMTATWVTKLQPVTDPMIYGYLNRNFRQSLNEIVNNCPCSFRFWPHADATNTDKLAIPNTKSEPEGHKAKQKVSNTGTDFSSPKDTGVQKIKGYSISADYHIRANLEVQKYEFTKQKRTQTKQGSPTNTSGPIPLIELQCPSPLGIRPITHPKNIRRIMTPLKPTHKNSVPSVLEAATPLVLHTCLPSLHRSSEPDIGLCTAIIPTGTVHSAKASETSLVEFGKPSLDYAASNRIVSGRCILPPLATTNKDTIVVRKRHRKKKPSYRWLKERKAYKEKLKVHTITQDKMDN